MLIVSELPANGGAHTNKLQRVIALRDAPLEDCQREYDALLEKLAPQAQAGGGVSSGGGRYFHYFHYFTYFFFISFISFFRPGPERPRTAGSVRPKKPPRLPDKEELRVLRAVVGEMDPARKLDKQVQLGVYAALSY